MSEVPNFKCKTCGALLDDLVAQSQNGLVECPYCQNVWTIPKKETSPAALSFLRMGEHDLDTCKFDDALSAYKKAADLDPNEPEAYFGMALAEFKVQYLKDEASDPPRLQPICHEATEKIFTECNAYLRALLKATPEQKAEYERRGKEIEEIKAEFARLKESGLDYDCFLCVKVTDNGTFTEDSKDAHYIYELLQRKGYSPFYSQRSLHATEGSEYEAHILYALMTSECMLVICRDESYLETTWVKSEYSRFLKLVNDEEKESDSITIVFNGTPIERLPGRSGKLQGIDFSRREADGKIVDFVEKHTPEAKARREEEKRQKTEQEKERAENEARIMAQLEEQRERDREREEKARDQERQLEEMRRMMSDSKDQERQLEEMRRMMTTGARATTGSLLTRAWQEMDSRDFTAATKIFDSVLDADPQNSEAWRGKFLAEFSTTSERALNGSMDLDRAKRIIQSKNLKNYLKYKKPNENGAVYKQILDQAKRVVNNEIQRCNKIITSASSGVKKIKTTIKVLSVLCFFVISIALSFLIKIISSSLIPTVACVIIGIIVGAIGTPLLYTFKIQDFKYSTRSELERQIEESERTISILTQISKG